MNRAILFTFSEDPVASTLPSRETEKHEIGSGEGHGNSATTREDWMFHRRISPNSPHESSHEPSVWTALHIHSTWVSEWLSEWVGEWVGGREQGSLSPGRTHAENASVNDLNGWVSEWVTEWVSQWMREWMNEYLRRALTHVKYSPQCGLTVF